MAPAHFPLLYKEHVNAASYSQGEAACECLVADHGNRPRKVSAQGHARVLVDSAGCCVPVAGIFQEKTPRTAAVVTDSPGALPGVGSGAGGELHPAHTPRAAPQGSDCRSSVQHCSVLPWSRL